MFAEKKLWLITEILKLEDNNVLDEVNSILANATDSGSKRISLSEFVGTMSEPDADNFQKIIEDGCGMKSINK